MPISIIDIFAGPGGLGEGFGRLQDARGQAIFRTALSIEMDPWARETLKLRAFVRAAKRGSDKALKDFRALQGTDTVPRALYEQHPTLAESADAEAWLQALGPETVIPVRSRIRNALERKKKQDWILIGGPPCQAYSLVGRSRNKGRTDYVFEEDAKTQLYLEYLQIVADHSPAVFVMENVKGLLSARFNAEAMFTRIQSDLENPAKALARHGRSTAHSPKYDLHTVAAPTADDEILFSAQTSPRDFLIRSEHYGVPQARHRVIVIGVRKGLTSSSIRPLTIAEGPSVKQAIGDLPRLRSGLSHKDSAEAWLQALRSIAERGWLRAIPNGVREIIQDIAKKPHLPQADRGTSPQMRRKSPEWNSNWYGSADLDWIWQHATRGHIPQDLERYIFAASWAQEEGSSPRLCDFPLDLLPKHANAKTAVSGAMFSDRFRVQLKSRPSTTVTSHISRDGHYYIHYDPTQCRSLTVREAARLQTFPDDYYFCGPRTSQYVQVGNAVPPYLAWQIAASVAEILGKIPNGQPLA